MKKTAITLACAAVMALPQPAAARSVHASFATPPPPPPPPCASGSSCAIQPPPATATPAFCTGTAAATQTTCYQHYYRLYQRRRYSPYRQRYYRLYRQYYQLYRQHQALQRQLNNLQRNPPYRYRYKYIYRNRYIYRNNCSRSCYGCGSCSRYEGRKLYKKGGPEFGFTTEGLAFLRSDGPLKYLKPTVIGNVYVGYNFSPLFGLRLGGGGGFFFKGSRGAELGDLKRVGYWNVTLDTRFRMRTPRKKRTWIPWVSAGIGVQGLYGRASKDPSDPDCTEKKTFTMAHGGALRLGLGVDMHVMNERKSSLVLGIGVQYQAMLMSGVACGPGGTGLCDTQNKGGVTHALTFGLSFGAAANR